MRLRRLSLHERRGERDAVVAAYAHTLAQLFATELEARRAAACEVDRWLAAPALEIFELREGGERVGALWLELAASGVAFIVYLAVDPAHRRRGHARAALRQAERYARDRGLRRMSLSVFTDNAPAVRLYRASGYEVVRQGEAGRHRMGKLLGPTRARLAS